MTKSGKSATSVALLPWSHNLLLLSKRLNDETTPYYAQETVTKGWNRDLLLNAIKLNMYEPQALARVDNKFWSHSSCRTSAVCQRGVWQQLCPGFLGVTSPIRRTMQNPNCLNIGSKGFCFYEIAKFLPS